MTALTKPRPTPPGPASGVGATCGTCRHFVDDPAALEKVFVGIGALSSAYGSTRGRAGICGKDDSFHDPIPACSEYETPGEGEKGS